VPRKLFTPGMARPAGAGRKPGQQNRTTLQIRALAQRLLTDREYQKNLRASLRNLTLDPGLIRMLYHYGYGKPIDTLEISGRNGGPIEGAVQIYLPDNDRDKTT